MAVTIRREVNLLNETLSSLAVTSLYHPGTGASLVGIDTDGDYSGTVTCYSEIVAKNTDSAEGTVIFYWDQQSDQGGASESNGSITVPAGTTAWTRFRSASFTPTAGRDYILMRVLGTTNADELQILAARIVIIQTVALPSDLVKSMGQFDVGYAFGVYTTDYVGENLQRQNPYYIHGDNFDQILDGYATVVVQTDSTKGTSGGSLVRLKYTTDFATWFDGPTIFSGAIAGRDPPFTFYETTFASSWITAPGGSTRPVWWGCSLELTAKDGFGMLLTKMGVRQDGGSTSSGITKTEDSYKMINQAVSTPNTGPSEFYTYFDPTTNEWDSIANEYYHVISAGISQIYEARQHLSSSGSTVPISGTEVALTTDHGLVLESTFGSSMTMPSSAGELDCFISAVGVN